MLKYYLCLFLLLFLIQIYGQNALIAKHGFEESGDGWSIKTISTPACTEDDDTWNKHSILGNILPNEGAYFWGIQDLNGNCGSSDFEYIEFNSFDISNFRNVTLSFQVIIQGYDNGDDMKYELYLDDISQGEVLFIDGQNDLTYDQWTTISIEIPNAVSSIKLRISIKQNGSDLAGLDHIRLEGEAVNMCSELMISEYLEGGSSTSHRNNYIELYNPRNERLDLSAYALKKYTGANVLASANINLKGIIEPYATFLIADHTQNLSITADLETNSSVMDYNGDDKIALHKNDTIIDLIGQIGDSINFGKNVTLRRKSHIKSPNNQFDQNEWDSYGFEDIKDLHTHASYCQGNLPEIEVYGQRIEVLDGSTSTSLINNSYFGNWQAIKDTIIQRSFMIKNTGNKILTIDDILISGSQASHFSTDFTKTLLIPANDSIHFRVSYKPNTLGLHTAMVEITNSDPSENPFEFTIQGEGSGPNSHPLIISQYYEGNANNKWIEITNISSHISPEDTYYLALYRNEDTQNPIGSKPSSKKLIPAIGAGQSIKYAASLNVTSPSYAIDGEEIKTSVCNFTGDDILIISNSDAESCWVDRTDIIGSSDNWGTNKSFIRKSGCDVSMAHSGFDQEDWHIVTNEIVDLAEQGSNLRIGIHTSGSTIWRDGSWTNGYPDINSQAIIESDFSTDLHGNIETCSLHVLKSAKLFVKSSGYLKIQRDLLVEGTLHVNHEGSLVMVDDLATIVNKGEILIHKSTTELNPKDYTYWSSPIENASLETVFWNSPKNSIYFFSTKDYEDLDNDGQDDNNNAWVPISGAMKVARGYISMAPETTPFAKIQHVTFNGKVNNGNIQIPVYAETESIPDHHFWNLIGNPYPSAINAELFLNHQGNKELLSKTLYFWTHSTPISADASTGTQRYTSDDYAMYTLGTGGIKANPTGKEPTAFISSCQGFFVEALKEGLLTFNNEMRTVVGNDNFFKSIKSQTNLNEKKIWLNLTNNQGAFSQILIGFIDGATSEFDNNFDGPRIDTQNPVTFFSLVEDKPYAIQGLPPFKGNEQIQLGLNNRIQEEILLKISIDHILGDFSNSSIILHDKELNTNHDLFLSPYSFTLEAPTQVNQRFELRFGSIAADNSESSLESSKIIWLLHDGILRVSTNNNETIKRLEIFDLNGREIIDCSVNDKSVSINWFGFPSRAIYVLRALLEDSRTITTKIIP